MLTQCLAQEAIRTVIQGILIPLATDATLKREMIHIVVAKKTPDTPNFEDGILWEESHNPDLWKRDYKDFAHGKAKLTWRTGFPSGLVVTRYPQMLLPGDCIYPGSHICGNIIVGVSGVQPHYDEALARMVAALCFGHSHQALVNLPDDVRETGFLPLETDEE